MAMVLTIVETVVPMVVLVTIVATVTVMADDRGKGGGHADAGGKDFRNVGGHGGGGCSDCGNGDGHGDDCGNGSTSACSARYFGLWAMLRLICCAPQHHHGSLRAR